MKKKTIVFGLITMLLPFFLMAQTKDIVETVTAGTGTNANYIVPFTMNWEYSMTQQIYPASEINQVGTISTISFYLNAGGSFTMDGVKIYMKHTDKSYFQGHTDWVGMASDDKVYEGRLQANGTGWVTLSWDLGNGEYWLFQYKEASATTWDGEETIYISDIIDGYYHLEGLSPNTTYNWQLALLCDGDETSPTTENGVTVKRITVMQ